jgi:hypothetical protein
MDKRNYSRLTGWIFVIGAVLGLFLSIFGLMILWSTRASVTRQVTETAALVGQAIQSTSETITVTSSTLDQAGTDLGLVQKMIGDMANTLGSSSGMISSTADLMGTNMVDFVNNTQTSLTSVQNSAKMIDSMLKTINGVPLLGPWLGKGYNPNMPLEDSVANVSRSLDPLPGAFTKIQRDLKVSSADVATVKTEMEVLARQVDAIQTSLQNARQVVSEYRGILDDVQARYNAFEKDLPAAINIVYLVLTLVLLWMLITQAGLLIQGLMLLEAVKVTGPP